MGTYFITLKVNGAMKGYLWFSLKKNPRLSLVDSKI